MKKLFIVAIALMLMAGIVSISQNLTPNGQSLVQPSQGQYYTIPLSATAAVNTALTLTIPAPAAGLYNYVCTLGLELSQDATGTAITNGVTSNTNFGTFAAKFSMVGTVNTDSGVLQLLSGSPSTGCSKSVLPGTATTFVTPQTAHVAYAFYATYFVAP